MGTSLPGALVRPLGRPSLPLVHEKAHPLVRTLFAELKRLGIAASQVEEAANLSNRALRNWARGGRPNVANLEAALAVVGLEIVARRPEARN
jgi:hypothetical protein